MFPVSVKIFYQINYLVSKISGLFPNGEIFKTKLYPKLCTSNAK